MSKELEYLSKRVAQNKMSRRDFMGRASALGVSAATAGAMVSTAALAEGPKKGGTIKLGMNGGAGTDSLDPGLVASQTPRAALGNWGDTLVNVSPSGELDLRIAESIDSSADAKTWHFNIRQGVEFHNGKSLTAEDAMKTIERHSNEESKSGALGIVKGIESMSVSGNTLTLNLDTPNADLPYLMADYHLAIQPNGGMDDPTAGIGSGPYQIESNEPGVRHTFTKFANYWDDSVGHADSVEILVINDATARMSALQSGQVHMVNSVDPKIAKLLDRAPNITVQNVSGRGHYVFIMHTDTAPFDNKDLRLALKYAINREEMVDKILRGYGGVGNDIPINAAYPLFDDSLEQREYDPVKAAELYKKSGHDGSPIILRVAETAFPGAVDAAQLFQQSAAAAGIPLEIKREPNDGYWSDVWNVQPFCASYWTGRPVQDQMYSTAYLSTADWNDTRFNNAEFDNLLNQAKAELDPVKRKTMYSQMAGILQDEGGVIVPMFNDFIDGVSNGIGGYVADPNAELMAGLAASRCWLK
ncbi:ABC transporter substrate-binding protein [Aliiroseovarius sp. KMU-50]|uniref:ABC transporter substrate-binding protein n=1 Tax=Aliiroseovarius salicola TaxID=3009082 RepID=A0ABT4VXZ8_9RHOB|nr:ABC transporter substrate-binding protein [Aliiroseovarius sp. KMU-50]MDA5093131.1 ABC transporter substrate-binding protein [Aliiroseovarius sp. KMU-50]